MALSFTIAEFLTGSTPFLTIFVDPLSLAFLFGLYGCGVLLVREAAVRWRGGWSTILFLGLAYGIIEEGFGTKTFFSGASSVVGYFTTYGRWAGVNWVWAVQLTIFHAVFSIALPILLLSLWMPRTRGRPLVQLRSLAWFLAAFAFTVSVMFVLSSGDNPSPGILLLFAVLVAGLTGLAWRVRPIALDRFLSGHRPSPRSLLILGALFVWLFFFTNWVLSQVVPAPIALIGLVTGLTALAAHWILPEFRSTGADFSRLVLSIGLLSFLIFFAGIVGVTGDWLVVVPLVAVLVLLVYLYRRLARPVPRPEVPAHVL